MKRKLILGIVLILIASFSLSLFSCDMTEQNGTTDTTGTTEDIVKETTSQETTDNEIKQTTSVGTIDGEVEITSLIETTDGEVEITSLIETTDGEVEITSLMETTDGEVEETTEDDYQGCVPMDERQQIFNSLDELLLAIEDIDAFCEVVTDNGEGEPVEPEFISEKLSLLNNYPIALIDNYSSFWAQLTHNVLYIMIFEEGTRYEFIYWFEADCVSRGNGDFFGELKIDDQYIEMYPRSYNSGLKYTYEGAWENNGMLVLVYVSGDSEELKTPESFQDQEIYTVDLFELASQRYGEETTSEESDAEGSETESIETESSIAN